MNTVPPFSGKRLVSERRSQNADMPWFRQSTDLDLCREQLKAAQEELNKLRELRALDEAVIAAARNLVGPYEAAQAIGGNLWTALRGALAARDAAIRAREGEE